MTKEESKTDSDRKRLRLEEKLQEEEKPMPGKTSQEEIGNMPSKSEENPKPKKSMIKGIWKRLREARAKSSNSNEDEKDRTQTIVDEEMNGEESDDSESDFDSDSDSDSEISIDEDSEFFKSLPRVPSKCEFEKLESVSETSISQGSTHSRSNAKVSAHAAANIPQDSTHSRTIPKVDLKDLAMTQFPDFFMEASGVPGLDLTDGSDEEDEATLLQKREEYSTKEDEDVAVFMSLARRMNLKSLLHLLQGHVQSTYPQYLQQYKAAIQRGDDSDDKNLQSNDGEEAEELQPDEAAIKSILKNPEKNSIKKEKQFRWALVTNGEIRKIVHEVECVKDEKKMWWAAHEMGAIRHELIDIVHYFRKHKAAYIRSVEMVARANVDEAMLEENLKRLSEDTYARGLETHIVQLLSTHRKSTIDAVIDEQRECRACGDDKETTEHCLREQSVAYSQLSTRFAYSMGRLDQIDALKASISRWKTAKSRFGMK